MKITVNGEPRETQAATLAALLAECDFAGACVATAVNGDFAPRGSREALTLREGDAVEVVAPMQGG
jgi:sulfur carrier protein